MSMMPDLHTIRQPGKLDIKPKDWQRYSISRAIRSQIDGHLNSFEGEMNKEITRVMGRSAEGCWVPGEAWLNRNYSAGTGTLGGMLVSTPNGRPVRSSTAATGRRW